ncbi:hypothetical protein ACOSQ2_017991 [Xanthoceras sorbifolium]
MHYQGCCRRRSYKKQLRRKQKRRVQKSGRTVCNIGYKADIGPIGCGHRDKATFAAAARLLELGGGSLSFVGQLGGQIGESG